MYEINDVIVVDGCAYYIKSQITPGEFHYELDKLPEFDNRVPREIKYKESYTEFRLFQVRKRWEYLHNIFMFGLVFVKVLKSKYRYTNKKVSFNSIDNLYHLIEINNKPCWIRHKALIEPPQTMYINRQH